MQGRPYIVVMIGFSILTISLDLLGDDAKQIFDKQIVNYVNMPGKNWSGDANGIQISSAINFSNIPYITGEWQSDSTVKSVTKYPSSNAIPCLKVDSFVKNNSTETVYLMAAKSKPQIGNPSYLQIDVRLPSGKLNELAIPNKYPFDRQIFRELPPGAQQMISVSVPLDIITALDKESVLVIGLPFVKVKPITAEKVKSDGVINSNPLSIPWDQLTLYYQLKGNN